MGALHMIGNSIKSFSKSCFEEAKHHSSKYTKALSQLKIDISKVSDIPASLRKYFADEMNLVMQDREGYFLKMKSLAKEGAENAYSNSIHGTNYDQYQQSKEQEAEAKKHPSASKGTDDRDMI